jgi:hypothetical protein
MLINTIEDLQAATDSHEQVAFLQTLLNDYVTFDDAVYPEDYDRSLQEGDEGYIAPVTRTEWNATAAASWGFQGREQIQALIA